MIFAKAQSAVETIVAALVIFSYTYLRRATSGVALANASFNQAGYIRFISLKEILGVEPSQEEYGALCTVAKETKKNNVRHYIVDVGHSIVNVIAGWNLIQALLH
jgi:hypothetical protein